MGLNNCKKAIIYCNLHRESYELFRCDFVVLFAVINRSIQLTKYIRFANIFCQIERIMTIIRLGLTEINDGNHQNDSKIIPCKHWMDAQSCINYVWKKCADVDEKLHQIAIDRFKWNRVTKIDQFNLKKNAAIWWWKEHWMNGN